MTERNNRTVHPSPSNAQDEHAMEAHAPSVFRKSETASDVSDDEIAEIRRISKLPLDDFMELIDFDEAAEPLTQLLSDPEFERELAAERRQAACQTAPRTSFRDSPAARYSTLRARYHARLADRSVAYGVSSVTGWRNTPAPAASKSRRKVRPAPIRFKRININTQRWRENRLVRLKDLAAEPTRLPLNVPPQNTPANWWEALLAAPNPGTDSDHAPRFGAYFMPGFAHANELSPAPAPGSTTSRPLVDLATFTVPMLDANLLEANNVVALLEALRRAEVEKFAEQTTVYSGGFIGGPAIPERLAHAACRMMYRRAGQHRDRCSVNYGKFVIEVIDGRYVVTCDAPLV